MKKSGLILIAVGVVVALALGLIVYGMLGMEDTPASDEEFLDSARQKAEHSTSGNEEGRLPPSSTPPDQLPKIEIETNHYDMGLIGNDAIAEGGVTIYNRGKAPLKIMDIKTTCACTQGFPPEGGVIPPESEHVMRVTVDPSRIPVFESHKTLTIYSNDPTVHAVSVDVTAKVKPEVGASPERLRFGDVPKGQKVERSTTIRQLEEDEPFEIYAAKVVGNSNYLGADYEEIPEDQWETPGMKEYRVTAWVTEDAPAGRDTRSQVYLGIEHERLKQMSIPMDVNVYSLYDIGPKTVVLKNVKVGEKREGVLRIAGKKPIEVFSVTTGSDTLEVTPRPGTDPNTVVFDATVISEPSGPLLRDNVVIVLHVDGHEFTEEVEVVANL